MTGLLALPHEKHFFFDCLMYDRWYGWPDDNTQRNAWRVVTVLPGDAFDFFRKYIEAWGVMDDFGNLVRVGAGAHGGAS